VTPSAPRGRSLFWTITGLFLLTVVLGTLIQALVADTVLRPLELREARARADEVAASLAAEIALIPGTPSEALVDTLISRKRAGLGPRRPWIAFRTADGVLFTVPAERAPGIASLLAGGEPAPNEAPPPPGSPRLEILARKPVTRDGQTLGEVLVMRPARPRSAPGFLASRTVLLSVPIAIIASGLMGLLFIRMLARRLRGLELLAARVAEGDLSVRIADPSGDEIGRLAERLDRMTDRLADARARLEANELQRRQLFADITHELATPLTSIRGYAETLLDPRVPVSEDERTRYVRGVLEESRRLDRLIRDLLELARLEAGATPLAKESLDWAALCRHTLERFEPRLREAGLKWTWRAVPAEAWIEADGRRVEQVLDNLITNALRYVPRGGTLQLALDRPPEHPDRFRLVVSDDGPGLPEEDLTRVFERFYRGSGHRAATGARDDLGSGLGLAIVREIVQRHGGSVRAEARYPRGISIVVELPARV
jgi:two-component system, OmpR family, sensor histidine kinase BaeS